MTPQNKQRTLNDWFLQSAKFIDNILNQQNMMQSINLMGDYIEKGYKNRT